MPVRYGRQNAKMDPDFYLGYYGWRTTIVDQVIDHIKERPLAFGHINPFVGDGIGYCEVFDKEMWPFAVEQGFFRYFAGPNGGIGGLAVQFERVTDQANSPDADKYAEQRGESCDPLCV